MLAVSLVFSGCAARETPHATDASDAAFCAARDRLEAMRKEHRKASKQTVKLTLAAPVMPQALSARGAVAADPPSNLRMILLGPGGATALDLWVHDTSYRFSVPALGRVIRGDESTPVEKRRGLPVDFLRWWMLDPFGGELLYATESPRGLEFVLRDRRRDGAEAFVDGVVRRDGSVDAERTTWSPRGEKVDEETVHATTLGCGAVSYTQASTRLTVEAVCESSSGDVNPRAFADPDAPPSSGASSAGPPGGAAAPSPRPQPAPPKEGS